MEDLTKEDWMKSKPFLAPKWMAKLIWFWILKEGKEKDPYAVGYKVIILAMGICVVIGVPLIMILSSYVK